jgi:hypothetical protein
MLEDAKTNMDNLSHDGSNNNHRVFFWFYSNSVLKPIVIFIGNGWKVKGLSQVSVIA